MKIKEIKELLQAIVDGKEGFLIGYHLIKQMQRAWGNSSLEQKAGASSTLKLLEMCEEHEPIKYKEDK